MLPRRLPAGAKLVAALSTAAAVGALLHLTRSRAGLDLALAVSAGIMAGAAVGWLGRPRASGVAVRLGGGATAVFALTIAAVAQHAEARAADADYRAQVAVAGAASSRPPLPGRVSFIAQRLGIEPGPRRLAGLVELFGTCAAGALAATWSYQR